MNQRLNKRLLLLLSAFLIFQSEQTFAQDSAQVKETRKEQIFMVVEVMPEFPGGPEKMLDFIARKIVYPDSAKEAGIEGRVIVQFVVDTTGDLIEAKVVRGIGYGCDEEVLRVISIMPEWSPGMQRGKKVRVRYNLPVKFQLYRDEPKKKERKERKRRLFRNRG